MSNQLVISSGAKVRNLDGVITGSTGVLNSLPINGSNGIPQLDVNGKILVSQLPNSVMEYKGTWDASTNTPTLVNGTGNQGDVYLCSVAGTVNFGAGPIAFVVSDQVIYSGTIWQKASGTSGTVTSVSVTESGDALTITGSPVTTSGTINIGFAGTSAQYVAGNGSLVTFPDLTGYVTLTTNQTISGAKTFTTSNVFSGANLFTTFSQRFNQGLGILETANPGSSYGYTNIVGAVNGLALRLSDDGKKTFAFASGTSNNTFTFPDASGTVALTSNLTAYVPYTGATADLNLGTHNLFTNNLFEGFTSVSASSTPIVLTIASTPVYLVTGSGGQTIKLPDATTLPLGTVFVFNNNQSSGAILVNNNSNTLVVSIPSGGYCNLELTDNSIAAGSWDRHFQAPSNVSWSTNTFDYPGSITSATWNGNVVAINRGGTGASTASTALANLGGVPTTRTLTINGTTYDLSADRSWSINSMVYPSAGIAVSTGTAWGTSITDNSSNWNTAYSLRITSATSPLSITSNVLSISQASGSTSGYLSSTDWTTFNSKQGAITLTTTGTSGAATLVGSTLNIPQYQAAGTYVTSVTGTSPIVSSGGTTPAISITQATTSTNGYLSSTDWNTFNGKQNALTNPVTGTGTSGQVTYFNGTSSVTGSNNLKFDGTNLSIGNPSSPLAQLHVYNASAAATILLQTNSTTDYSEIAVRNNSSTATSYFRQYSTATTGSDFGISRAGLALFFSNYATNFAIGTRNGGDLILGTADTERARILASNGYVGINTSSPSYLLDVNGTGRFGGTSTYNGFLIGSHSNNVGAAIYNKGLANATLYADSASTVLNAETNLYLRTGNTDRLTIASTGAATFSSSVTAATSILNSSATTMLYINTTNASGASNVYQQNGTNVGWIGNGSSSLIGGSTTDFTINGQTNINFAIGGYGKMLLNSTGKFLIGTTTDAGGELQVLGQIRARGGTAGLYFQNQASTNNFAIYGNTSIYFYNSDVGLISSIHYATGVYTPLSDFNKKKDFEDSTIGLNAILGLKPTLYRMKSDDTEGNKELGFIAQEVNEFIPQAFVESGDEDNKFIGLNYNAITATLVKAIQEQQKQIEELKAKIK
ncbi:Intramolecular chaperone auto-processing domain containing protein [uncultured Caudovirales phage]|uniref:Intramolecular chaperone auto-processing domain containing protein n=1 Tax=uncultured Caudovirales phage TaxID=2100421 RepID=A0A6J7WNM1_9CAUD|nr:Intramolecular chaperone auto-processing domain containing protein [uncultured Caudovirales phage]